MGIKTIEQAQALPEEDYISWETKVDPITHHDVIKPIVRTIFPVGVEENDIIMFHDKDGRLMKIIGVDGNYAKCEVR